MSLINKMLKDLESRQNAPLGKPSSRPIFHDLRPVSDGGLMRWMFPTLMIGSIALAVVVALYIWTHRAIQAPLPTSKRENQQPAVTESVVTAVQEPVTLPTPSVASPTATPVSVAPMVATIRARATPEPVSDTAKPARPTTTKAPAKVPEKVQVTQVARPAPSKPLAPAAKPATQRKSAPPPAPPVVQESADSEAQDTGQTATEANVTGGSMEKKNIPLTPEQTAENTYRAAALQLQQRHLDEAEQGFKAALAINPRHVAAREMLAGLLLQRTRMDEAQQLLEQGLAAVPGQTSFATLLARIYVEQNTEPKAIALLEQQRSSTKPNPDTLALLATLYQRAGRHDAAIAAFKDALTLRPLEGKWWLGLGISQEAVGDWNEARFAYERVRNTNVSAPLAQYAEQRLAIVRSK